MNTRQMILTALFAGITAVGALIRIPMPPSAITLQFFCCAVAGTVLGRRYGALSQIIYVLLGLLGLPVFAMGGGVSYVLQPTFGFTLGLIAAAWVIGHLTLRRCDMRQTVLACLAGLGAVYAIGLSYMAAVCNLYLGQNWTFSQFLLAGVIPFLPADMVKIALCAMLCPKLRRMFGNIH